MANNNIIPSDRQCTLMAAIIADTIKKHTRIGEPLDICTENWKLVQSINPSFTKEPFIPSILLIYDFKTDIQCHKVAMMVAKAIAAKPVQTTELKMLEISNPDLFNEPSVSGSGQYLICYYGIDLDWLIYQ